jgi:predicted DNA-binding ribbon-helix-helix protein
MNSSVKRHSIAIGSRNTSISLEDVFWACVKQIARERAITVSELIGMIDAGRNGSNLSSAIRVFVLDHYSNNAPSGPIRGAERPKVQG